MHAWKEISQLTVRYIKNLVCLSYELTWNHEIIDEKKK
jgi:hypothetical protein